MKAVVQYRYGSPGVLRLEELQQPVINADQVLLRIRAAAANPYDWHFMRGQPYVMRLGFGLRKPKHRVLGSDVAGHIEAVGSSVTRFRPGDAVYGGIGLGGFAEFASAAESVLALKPANLTFEQAAAVPMAATTALQGLRDAGRLRHQQRVLIIGASGGVGTFAVQLAKMFGAHVTGVCSTRNVDLVRSLGADEVIDYTAQDYLRTAKPYDVVFQLAGTRSAAECRRVLTPRGTLVLSSGDGGPWLGPLGRMLQGMLLSRFVPQRVAPFMARDNAADLQTLKDLIEAGKVTPVIDTTYTLEQTANALRHVETGHARGKIVVTV
jgi:NADPH:quinone reductase-like Zn-dependent oxidoreductase